MARDCWNRSSVCHLHRLLASLWSTAGLQKCQKSFQRILATVISPGKKVAGQGVIVI